MAEKEQIAARLLSQGLTVTQICQQLRCSPYFVRRARQKLQEAQFGGAGAGKALSSATV
jgi:transposase-like protein